MYSYDIQDLNYMSRDMLYEINKEDLVDGSIVSNALSLLKELNGKCELRDLFNIYDKFRNLDKATYEVVSEFIKREYAKDLKERRYVRPLAGFIKEEVIDFEEFFNYILYKEGKENLYSFIKNFSFELKDMNFSIVQSFTDDIRNFFLYTNPKIVDARKLKELYYINIVLTEAIDDILAKDRVPFRNSKRNKFNDSITSTVAIRTIIIFVFIFGLILVVNELTTGKFII